MYTHVYMYIYVLLAVSINKIEMMLHYSSGLNLKTTLTWAFNHSTP